MLTLEDLKVTVHRSLQYINTVQQVAVVNVSWKSRRLKEFERMIRRCGPHRGGSRLQWELEVRFRFCKQ